MSNGAVDLMQHYQFNRAEFKVVVGQMIKVG